MSPECVTSCPTAGCCSTTCRSGSATARRSRWSAPTAPARPRCCGIITGDLDPHAGAVTRTGGLGVMRQMVGADLRRRPDRRRPAAVGGAAARARGRGGASSAAELALMETDDEQTQLRYAAGAGGVRRRRAATTSRWSGTVLHDRALGLPYDRREVPRGSHALAAASRSGWCWSTSCAGPTRCCCSTSRTTSSTCPARSGSSSGSASPPKTILFISHDRELLDHTATADRHRRARRGRQHGVDAPRRVRVVPRGAARPVRPLRGAAPALGRGARQAQGAGAAVQDQGGVQRRHGLAVPGGADPAAQVRGGRPAAPSSRASSR